MVFTWVPNDLQYTPRPPSIPQATPHSKAFPKPPQACASLPEAFPKHFSSPPSIPKPPKLPQRGRVCIEQAYVHTQVSPSLPEAFPKPSSPSRLPKPSRSIVYVCTSVCTCQAFPKPPQASPSFPEAFPSIPQDSPSLRMPPKLPREAKRV